MTRVYEYDVFISYRRVGSDVPTWIRNHFYPRLSEVLDNNLDRDVKIFFDHSMVPTGARWPAELCSALQRTRILLPVCSPKYFNDEWCMAEWKSMELREMLAGMASPERPRNLIYPVIFSDSATFPPFATVRRMRNFNSLNHPHQQFERSLKYLEFDDEVKRSAVELARLFDQVPTWRPDWPVETPAADPPKTARFPRL